MCVCDVVSCASLVTYLRRMSGGVREWMLDLCTERDTCGRKSTQSTGQSTLNLPAVPLNLPERCVGATVAGSGGGATLVEFLDDDGELLLEVDDALS